MKFIFFSLFLLMTITAIAEDDFHCPGDKVCRSASTLLPLLGLPRPFSNIYKSADASPDNIFVSNIKSFSPLYIFDRKDISYTDATNPTGWYRIGASDDDPLGWMQAKDVMEWKQALIVAYTHPGTPDNKRNPVLMFNDVGPLVNIVESDDMVSEANRVYGVLKTNPTDLPEAIVSAEPENFVDIVDQFYILPVLDFIEVDYFDDESRLLLLAAAVPGERAEGDENTQTGLQEELLQRETEGQELPIDISTLGVDVKFVIDTTGSMKPFIDATREAVTRISQKLSGDYDFVQFGLVGYSDEPKDYTPSGLVDVDGFIRLIKGIHAQGGNDYQEEVFAGIKTAIESKWNENTLRVIILIGDASSHAIDHEKNLTGMDDTTLRDLANSHGVYILSAHLKDARAKSDHPIAQKQFSSLAFNPGAKEASYVGINSKSVDELEETLKTWTESFSEKISSVRKGDVKTVIEDTKKVHDSKEKIATDVIGSALIRYLGKAEKPPRDVTVWVFDKDLADPARSALDVRILLSKSELNDLIIALEDVLKAVKRSDITGMEFFESLQGVVASSAKKRDVSFSGARKLSETDLMPVWIESLPYRSQILDLSNEIFASMSADERAQMEQRIENLLSLYREYNENADLWQQLNERSADSQKVFPLSLTVLP